MLGDLQNFALAEVIQMMADLRKTGALRISRDRDEAAIIFRDGDVLGAASNTLRETTGSLLIARGVIDEHQLERALEVQQSSVDQLPLGTVLVGLDFASPAEIAQVVTEQIQSVVQDLLERNEGFFEFVPLEGGEGGGIQGKATDLLEEGVSTEGILFRHNVESGDEEFLATDLSDAPTPAGNLPDPQESRLHQELPSEDPSDSRVELGATDATAPASSRDAGDSARNTPNHLLDTGPLGEDEWVELARPIEEGGSAAARGPWLAEEDAITSAPGAAPPDPSPLVGADFISEGAPDSERHEAAPSHAPRELGEAPTESSATAASDSRPTEIPGLAGLSADEERAATAAATGTPHSAGGRASELTALDLEQLLAADPEPSLVVDGRGTLLYANHAAGAAVGSTSVELLGRPLASFVHPDDASIFEELLGGGHRGTPPRPLTIRLLQSNGRSRSFYLASGTRPDDEQDSGPLALLRATSTTEIRPPHDRVTGLLSRYGLVARIEEAARLAVELPGRKFAVVVLDIDRFELINDSLGWDAGDELLRSIGDRLANHLRPSDALARIAGNEFGVLLDGLREHDDVRIVCERLAEVVRTPLRLSDEEVYVSATIGAATNRAEPEDAEEMLHSARAAQRAARLDRSASPYIVETRSGGRSEAGARLRVERDLQHAVEDNEFVPYYQPIVSLDSGRVVAFELLARWLHPHKGLLPPSEFIPVAEQTGLIVPMAKLLLRDGCSQLRRWQHRLAWDPPLSIGMNITAAHLERAEFMNTVRSVLDRRGIEGRQLVVEITESMMIRRRDKVLQILAVLKEMGVRIFVDDFGVEYSSLSYLHEFPIDAIKLNRSFVRKVCSNKSVEITLRSIVDLAHELGKAVVAEGVETHEELRMVRDLGCAYAQGFLFSRPREAFQVDELLGEPAPWKGILETEEAQDGDAASTPASVKIDPILP